MVVLRVLLKHLRNKIRFSFGIAKFIYYQLSVMPDLVVLLMVERFLVEKLNLLLQVLVERKQRLRTVEPIGRQQGDLAWTCTERIVPNGVVRRVHINHMVRDTQCALAHLISCHDSSEIGHGFGIFLSVGDLCERVLAIVLRQGNDVLPLGIKGVETHF